MKVLRGFDRVFTVFKLRDKFIVSYILLLVIPVILVTSIFYRYYIQTSERQTRNIMEQTVNQTNLRLQNLTRQITDLGNYVMKAYAVQDFLSKENYGTFEEVQEGDKVDSIKQAGMGISSVLQVRFYIDDRKIYARQRSSNSFPLSELPGNIRNCIQTGDNSRFHWSEPYSLSSGGEAPRVVTYVISIYDALSVNKLVGVLCIDISETQFSSIIEEIQMDMDEMLLISDSGDQVFVSSGHFRKNGISQDAVAQLQGAYFKDRQPEIGPVTSRIAGFTMITARMEIPGWKLLFAVSDQSVSRESSRIAVFVAVILILVLVAAILSAVMVSNGITLKIRKLTFKMKNIHETYLTERQENRETYREDEIGVLDRNFDRMTEKIRQLVQENYEAGIQKKDIELRLLQSQINPHFLYNVLESINWMSIRERNYKVSEALSQLGRYYRLSLSKGKEMITLEEEFAHTQLYLALQKNRFDEKISYDVELDPALAHCVINKIVIQPLVENAIEHGILTSPEGKGEVRIFAERTTEGVTVCIVNTGNKISLDRVEKCLAGDDQGREGGYGLKNVNDRIKLTFGEAFGLGFRTEGGWTIAELKIPFSYGAQ